MKIPKAFRVVLVVIAVALPGASVFWYCNYGPTAFDPVVWRQGEQAEFSPDAPRLRMADQLVQSKVLVGKPKPEILAMLGAPSQTDKFNEYDLVYWLGAERGFISIDSEWLVLKCTESGIVKEARIVRD
ncbi:MAG: hypothetical protein HY774_02435 [Acidobacteria bacterium]|nr:hypothetical protein [Acidobacteriota bacterium]